MRERSSCDLSRRACLSSAAALAHSARRDGTMSRTMKAAVVHRFQEPLRVEELPIPEPGDGQVLVKIEASGVCHTDLHAAGGDWPVKPAPPFIPGHEGAGICRSCWSWGNGRPRGRSRRQLLHRRVGNHLRSAAEFELFRQRRFRAVRARPRGVRRPAPGRHRRCRCRPRPLCRVTTYKGLKQTEARPGEWVVISGVGGLGRSCSRPTPALARAACGSSMRCRNSTRKSMLKYVTRIESPTYRMTSVRMAGGARFRCASCRGTRVSARARDTTCHGHQ